jgi:ABC-type transport system involved in multi-copper enzyme maturation permease subunit
MGDRLAAFVSAVTDRVFGPVFTLDATRAGRRWSTFALRWFYLLCLVFVLGIFFYAWRKDLNDGRTVDPNVLTRFAENFFWVYSVTQFLLVAAVTPGVTAGAITDEKERKTLHFLLATDLSGREIVFGKLAARVGALMTLVLAGLPVIAIMQFFGGIEPRLLLVAVGMTTVSVVSLAALGVAASVLLPRTRDAIMLAYGVPVVYVWLSLWAWSDLHLVTEPALAEAVRLFACGNPFVAAREMARTLNVDTFPAPAVWYVGFHAAFAVAAIAVAAARVRSSVRSEGAAAAPRSAAARTLAWVMGRRSHARWHPPLRGEPVRWRELHVEPGSGSGVVQRVFAVAVLGCVFLPFLNIAAQFLLTTFDGPYSGQRYWRSPLEEFRSATKGWVCIVTCLFGLLVLLRTTVRGASAVAGERDRDTWVSLVCTPLTVREILYGKWVGCVLGQKDAFLLLAVVWGIGVVTLSVNPVGIALTAVSLAVYMNLFAALGLSASATAKNSRIAIGRSVPMTLLLVGGYWFFLSCCCAGVGLSGGSGVGEAVGYVAAFVAAATPAVVLGGLPALDFEWFREMRGRDYSVFGAMALGWVVGLGGWTALALYWREQARDGFAQEANRLHELPGARPLRPRPAPREAGRPDRWSDPGPT